MSRITFEVIGAFGGKWRGLVYVDGHLIVTKVFEIYEDAYIWCMQRQTELSREVTLRKV